MKWVLVSNDHHQQVYELWNNDEKLLGFSHHLVHGTIRIFAEERRVFQLRKKGLLKNKTVLLNEYGIKIASLVEETVAGAGAIEIDQKKLTYSIHNRLYKEVFIYSNNTEKPFITCDLPPVLNNYIAQLLVLCWFKLQPQKHLLQSA